MKNNNAPTRAKVDISVMRSELQMVILTSGRALRRPRSSILNSLLPFWAAIGGHNVEERTVLFRFSAFFINNGQLHQIVWQGAVTTT